MRKKALVLGGALDQKILVEAFQKRGFYTIIMDYYENSPAKQIADKHYRESTYDKEKALEIARIEEVSYIATVSTDQPLLVAAYVAETLGLKFHLTYEKALSITNKSYMKQIMHDHNIPTTPYMIIKDISETEKLRNLKYPAVIKPVDSSGSRGVFVVQDYDHAKKNIKHSFDISATSTVIVEEFAYGLEISIDAMVVKGETCIVMISDNYKTMNNKGTPLFCRSEYPSIISDNARTNVNIICQQICNAFKLDNTPLFVQAIVEGDNVKIIEFSARIAGGSKPYFIKRAIDVNLVDAYVALTIGEYFEIRPIDTFYMLTLNYLYCREGILQHFEGHEQLIQEGLMDALLTYKLPLDKVGGLTNGSDRVGAFFVSGSTKDEIQKKTSIINARLKALDSCDDDILLHDII